MAKGKNGPQGAASVTKPAPKRNYNKKSKMNESITNDPRLTTLLAEIEEEERLLKEEKRLARARTKAHKQKIQAMKERLLREELKILQERQQAVVSELQLTQQNGSSREPSNTRQPKQGSSGRELSSAVPESSSSSRDGSSSELDQSSPKSTTPTLPLPSKSIDPHSSNPSPGSAKTHIFFDRPQQSSSNPGPGSAKTHIFFDRPQQSSSNPGLGSAKTHIFFDRPQQSSSNPGLGSAKTHIFFDQPQQPSSVPGAIPSSSTYSRRDEHFGANSKGKKETTVEREKPVQVKREIPNIKQEVANIKREIAIVKQEIRARSSSPEIVSEKAASNKRQGNEPAMRTGQPENKVAQPLSRFPGKVFVPVTSESIAKVLKILDDFEKQKRCAAIVFNGCFYLDDIPIKVVMDKYSPIFGQLKPEQILLRVDIDKLTRTPEEAYKLGFKQLNQAYIIAEKNLSENTLNRRAAAQQVFCCPMTMQCIKKNLKQGVYLMHRSVVLGCTSTPKIEVPDKGEEIPPEVVERTTATESDGAIAEEENTKPKIEQKPPQKVPNLTESLRKHCKLDDQSQPDIPKSDGVVLKIENLPPNTTVHSLNLMMGTFSLKGHQMTAIKRRTGTGVEVMDMMIVTKSDNKDWERILEKDGLKTGLGLKLRIKRSHHGPLRTFIANNSSNLIQLETSDKLPIKWIGYGEQSQ